MRWSVVTSGETRVTTPFSSGVVRWLKADSRSSGLLADLQFVDVLRIDLGLDLEVVGLRHDHHDGVAGGDHAADGVNRRLLDHAVLRRADIDPPQLVFGRDLALDEFADLVVGLAQILGDVADHVLVDLDDLQFGFGDLALGLRDRGDDIARVRR